MSPIPPLQEAGRGEEEAAGNSEQQVRRRASLQWLTGNEQFPVPTRGLGALVGEGSSSAMDTFFLLLLLFLLFREAQHHRDMSRNDNDAFSAFREGRGMR